MKIQRALYLARLFVVAMVLTAHWLTYAGDALAAPAQDRGGPIVSALRDIAKMIVDILIGMAAILMAVGIATGFVGGQFLVAVGAPYGMSSAWIKVVSVIILGIFAFLTITLANTIIDAVAGHIPATEIVVP